MRNLDLSPLRRPLLAAALLGLTLAGCSGTSPEQTLRQDYVVLKGALEKFAKANGEYPERLAQLAEPDRRGRPYINEDSLTDPYGNPYAYDPPVGAKPPVLRSHGTDGVNGSPDDDIDLARISRAH